MKKMYSLLAALFLAGAVHSQLPNGIIAPDFTATDIDGNTWQLYDLLDQGKSVVLHFSTTWSDASWAYHQAGILNNLYEQYGPAGTGEMVAFLIETDDSTTPADLAGTGSDTQGDWLAGTTYPVIDDASALGDLYIVENVPAVYHICPNRVLTNAGSFQLWQLYQTHQNCLLPFGENNAGILRYVGFQGDFCDEVAFSPSIRFQNLGTQALTAASFELLLNGSLEETRQWMGNLPLYGTAGLTFDELTVTENTTVEILLTSVNGTDDEDPGNDQVSATVQEAPASPHNLLRVEIRTDDYPAETYWEIRNADGTIFHSGGNPGISAGQVQPGTYATANTTYLQETPLPGDGCWEFVIYDAYGDGICCGFGLGYYRLLEPNNNILLQGGLFGAEERRPFRLEGAASFSDNGAILGYTGPEGDFCGVLEFSPEVRFQNLGSGEALNAVLQVSGNGTVLQNFTWNGALPSGQATNIVLDPVELTASTDLEIRVLSVNGQPDIFDFKNDFETKLFRRETSSQPLDLQIQTDQWAYEMYWQLTNAAGTVIASGGNPAVGPNGGGLRVAQAGNPGAYPDNTLIETQILLPAGVDDCYEFLMVDDWGDGLQDFGFFRLKDADGNFLLNVSPRSAYASNLIDVFDFVNPTAESSPVLDFQLSPNPAAGDLRLLFYLEQTVRLQVEILNAQGLSLRQVAAGNFPAGDHSLPVDLHSLPAGLYFLKMGTGEKQAVKKFVIAL